MSIPSPSPIVKISKAAEWSLALGIWSVILTVVCVGPLLAIPAVICGHIAYSRIGKSGGALAGKRQALGGLITGYFVLALFSILAIVAPNFVRARGTSAKNPCINNLRQIDAAKEQWALEYHKTNGTMIVQSEVDGYIKKTPVCPQGGTYKYNVVGVNPTCSIPSHALP